MKKKSYLQASKTNFRRLRQMKAADVKVTPEHPELDVKEVARAIVRKGLKPVPPKAPGSRRFEADCLSGFSSREGGHKPRSNPNSPSFTVPTLRIDKTDRAGPEL